MMNAHTPWKIRMLKQSAILSFHLAHIESVCKDEDVGVELVGGEGEGKDLKVPDDPHPQEEPQVDAHRVHLLRPTSLLVGGAEGKNLFIGY